MRFPWVLFPSQVQDLLLAYADEKVKLVMNEYKEIFDALPFHDKERSVDCHFGPSMQKIGQRRWVEAPALFGKPNPFGTF